MKVTKDIVEILENFQKINPHIIFEKGDVVKTISPSKNFFAYSKIDFEFPQEIAVYNLNQLTQIFSTLNEPEMKCHDTYFEIIREPRSTIYYYSDPEVMTNTKTAKNLKFTLPSCDASFKISFDDIKLARKMCQLLDKPAIMFSYENNKIAVKTYDIKNESANEFRCDLEMRKCIN